MKIVMIFGILVLTGCSSTGQPPTVFEQYMIKRASNPALYQSRQIQCTQVGNSVYCQEI